MPKNESVASGATAVRLFLDASREAERILEEEARRHPDYADIRYRRGLLWFERGDLERAARDFEDALGIHPGYRAAYHALCLVTIQRGGTPFKTPAVAGSEAPSADELLWAGIDEAYARRARGEDPLSALRDVAPPLLVHHYAAAFASQSEDWAAARAHFETAAAASAVSARCLAEMGILPWSDGGAAAAAQYGRLLWTPLAADLYAHLGRIYATHHLREEAELCCARAFLVFPREAVHALRRGELATALGDEAAALAQLRRAVELDASCVEARITLGFEYAAQGFAAEATVEFEHAARLAPRYADVRYNLGLLYMGGGRDEAALEEFRGALGLNRSYVPARHSMASLLCRLGRYEEGLREYQRLLRQGFQSADMLVQMGRAALALNRTDEAMQYLERAKFLNPEFVLCDYYLGQAYRRKGLRNKARAAWHRYLEQAGERDPYAAQIRRDQEACDQAPEPPAH